MGGQKRINMEFAPTPALLTLQISLFVLSGSCLLIAAFSLFLHRLTAGEARFLLGKFEEDAAAASAVQRPIQEREYTAQRDRDGDVSFNQRVRQLGRMAVKKAEIIQEVS